MATELAAALAFELGNHIDDLVGSGTPDLVSEDGEPMGNVADTTITGEAHSFLVVMGDGRRVRVTCEEVAQ